MSDAHQHLAVEGQPLTEHERILRACDWSDYRKAYGCSPDPAELKREHILFCAGWDAGRRSEQEDPSKDERLARYMAMVTPLGYQSALNVVQQMTALIDAENRARSIGGAS